MNADRGGDWREEVKRIEKRINVGIKERREREREGTREYGMESKIHTKSKSERRGGRCRGVRVGGGHVKREHDM